MTITEYNTNIWSYYLQLESDFYDTLNFVEFSDDNATTFSKEYAKQLLSICSEVDVVFKLLCEQVAPNDKRKCITDYAKILCEYNNLPFTKVNFSYNKKEYVPFEGWTESNSPQWWKDYNDVKHHRTDNENYKKSNLKNVFDALAGLYVLNRYYCKILCSGKIMKEPEVKSILFNVVGWDSCIPIGNGFVQVLQADGGMSIVFDGWPKSEL